MSKMIKVSLCLITYNQPDSVARFLEAVGRQAVDGVEVLVRDDSPNNDTLDIVNACAPGFPVPLRYFKGEKSTSGGYDKALLYLTAQAEGEYIWWYGDDILADDAISRVLAALASPEKFALVWLNARNIHDPTDKGLDLGCDHIFETPGEIFATNVGLLGFPSATIIRRELVAACINKAQKFVGTTLTGFYLVLSAITVPRVKSFYIQQPCLLSQPKPAGEVRWYDSFGVHGINYTLISLEFGDRIDGASYRKGISDHYGRIWRAVVYERAVGLETGFASRSPKLAWMARLYWTYPEFYIALPLMLIPRPVLGMAYRTYRVLRGL
jgi:abequosyltransferase